MAHPDHDQVIGRLVGARLRGTADRRAVSGGAAEAHPDAETWAAYVDGGLQADEVVRLETHLAGCPACRRLLAVLVDVGGLVDVLAVDVVRLRALPLRTASSACSSSGAQLKPACRTISPGFLPASSHSAR